MPVILKIAVPLPLRRTYDYLPPENTDPESLLPGIRISVPFGNQKQTGYLLEITNTSTLGTKSLKHAYRILDPSPLISQTDLDLLRWASRYYHHPIGEVISTAFPVLLRQGKTATIQPKSVYALTQQGQQLPTDTFKRAPRQAELVALINAQKNGLDPQTLANLDWNWHSSMRSLISKGWVETHTATVPKTRKEIPQSAAFTANPAQTQAIESIHATFGSFKTFLLDGVTGSGKTEVYLQLIAKILNQRQQALVLLPEITLTPQLQARFQSRFATSIAVFHSGLTEIQRRQAWLDFQSGEASILLGTRSAAFIPMQNPGLIILDEEHDSSFTQQEGFRFSARDYSVMRASKLNIPIILGTATPSLETLHNTLTHRYQHLKLPERAGLANKPTLRLLDIRELNLQGGISTPLETEIRATLERGEQVLVFLNRRGFAPTLICHRCGWVARCQHCDANLVIHQGEQQLRCHHCDSQQALINHCPACQSVELLPLGLGTEKTEQILAQLFSDAKVARIDRDSTRRKGSLEKLLQDIHAGHIQILLGTQMLAKGHHFPNVTLVGILDVDSGLFSIDFRATERMAQMIIQVTGRAGREQKPGTVILQTRHPQHPLLLSLLRDGYPGFAKIALEERQQAGLPPFIYQALLRAEAEKAEPPLAFLESAQQICHSLASNNIAILGPVAAPMAKRAGRFRYQLLLQSVQRDALHDLLKQLVQEMTTVKKPRSVRWSIDIDPSDLY